MKILTRPIIDADHNFVYATYLRNRWFDKNNLTTLRRKTWSVLQHKRLEDIMRKKLVVIACLDEDPDVIVGYALRDQDKLYCYIKLSFRNPNFHIEEKLLKELL